MGVLLNCFIVGIGGAAGTICRYLLGLIPIKLQNGFPIITLCINVIGSLLIGIIVAFAAKSKSVDPHVLLMLKVGFCGSFTTFSTFSLETSGLLQNGNYFTTALYVVLSFVLCILAVIAAQSFIK